MSIIKKLNLTEKQVLMVVNEWYTNGMCDVIFQDEDGVDLEEYIEELL